MPLIYGRHFCLWAYLKPTLTLIFLFILSFSYSATFLPGLVTLDCKKTPWTILLLYQLSSYPTKAKNPVDYQKPNYPDPPKNHQENQQS